MSDELLGFSTEKLYEVLELDVIRNGGVVVDRLKLSPKRCPVLQLTVEHGIF
jgi:hypothetical protein